MDKAIMDKAITDKAKWTVEIEKDEHYDDLGPWMAAIYDSETDKPEAPTHIRSLDRLDQVYGKSREQVMDKAQDRIQEEMVRRDTAETVYLDKELAEISEG